MQQSVDLSSLPPAVTQLVNALTPGDQVILTKEGEAVAVVTRSESKTWPSKPGGAKHRAFWMAPDFDAPLADFAEYME